MKTILFATAAMIASPLMAQTTQPNHPTPDNVMSPSTPGSTQQTQGPTPPPADSAPMNTPAPAPAAPPPSDMAAAPAPAASMGPLPWCRPGQYTGCREHANKKGEGLRKN